MTDFNQVPNRRRSSNSIKWQYYSKEVLPMWVADMEFPAPKPILRALHKAVDHGVLGYELPSNALKETVASRMDKLYGWRVKPEAVVTVTGIVSGFRVAARIACTTQKGVLIQTPVYNEFHEVKNNIGIPQLESPLIKHVVGNILSYEIDWDIFEMQVKKAGMFLLCNPHNPLGLIFSRKDLRKMAELCIKNNVLIVSDEIHSELLLDDNKFTPLAKLSAEIAKHTITLVAPSKTFNIAGLFCGFAIITDNELRDRYEKEVTHQRMHVGSMGLIAAQSAFSGVCDGWLKELRGYLTDNRDFLVEYVTEYMPQVRLTMPDATYLGWLDFTQTGMIGSPYEFFLKTLRSLSVMGNCSARVGKAMSA
ncbi:aminotransferase class I/II-fold pyridoxal phosphate-dependent enzyme [Candidatus Villigracilis saccharophilus]|uniref:MalY/PatB family protein n=1 Tax=Candidatus Villigracilis saccharophilus TaxID=3140684 RepID=UPI0031368F34|nr:aminotransferase class I/II-fold pyridoxal phosphate-dependent enzyme [Anaerolineales bacterium]